MHIIIPDAVASLQEWSSRRQNPIGKWRNPQQIIYPISLAFLEEIQQDLFWNLVVKAYGAEVAKPHDRILGRWEVYGDDRTTNCKASYEVTDWYKRFMLASARGGDLNPPVVLNPAATPRDVASLPIGSPSLVYRGEKRETPDSSPSSKSNTSSRA